MPPDFRARVVACARVLAARAIVNRRRRDPPALIHFAQKIRRAPDSDLVFTDLADRVDPGDSLDEQTAVGTNEELMQALHSVWAKAAAEFDPGPRGTA